MTTLVIVLATAVVLGATIRLGWMLGYQRALDDMQEVAGYMAAAGKQPKKKIRTERSWR